MKNPFCLLLVILALISCGKNESSKVIIIREMSISNLPLLKSNGNPWDFVDPFSSPPDVAVRINGNEIYDSSGSDLSQTITIGMNIEISYGSNITIVVVDKDPFNSEDLMFSRMFSTNFPEIDNSIILQNSGVIISIDEYEVVFK